MFKKWSIATNILFPATAFFYFLAAFLKPGFVIPEFDILELLRIANDKQIDLDNFCFYCRVIKSGRTVHCNFCNRCVEKFDHHCNFVNNCLGYRNHKYFLAFIFLYLGYFTTSSVASVMSFFTHIENDSFSQQMDYVFRILSLIFNCTQLIPLFYQIKEQSKKLMKRTTRFKGVRRMRGKSLYENAGSSGDSSEGGDSIQKKASVKRSGTAF
jgi:DHHC palmitoyltransferase